MKIIVDGDACPGIPIIEFLSKKNNIDLVIYCDIYHNIMSDYGIVKRVDKGFQSVDMYVVNEAKKDDIVITQDYGVAAMVLGKGSYCISPKGYVYTNENIERLLFERHVASKQRRGGFKTGTNKKRTLEDDDRLEKNLEKIIINILSL